MRLTRRHEVTALAAGGLRAQLTRARQATEKRLKDILAGKKPAGSSGSLVGRRKTAGAAAQRPQISVFQARRATLVHIVQRAI